MRRWLMVVLAASACAEGARALPEPDLQARYEQNCAACHEAGAADAPRRGDHADWVRRRRLRDVDGMLARAKEGMLAMPPKGLCYDCSDHELEGLVRFVSGVGP